MQAIYAANTTRENNGTRYLEEFHGVWPQEGDVVKAGFQHVVNDIDGCRERLG